MLKNQISELSKANYELEREARMFDQRIGLLINYKKATEVGYIFVDKFYRLTDLTYSCAAHSSPHI